MGLNKDDAMLVDIQYVRANRSINQPDYLYIIRKDLHSEQKHLEKIANPVINCYFEKPEYRDYNYNKTEERIEKLYKKTVPYNQVIPVVAQETGPESVAYLQKCYQTRDWSGAERVKLSRYAFGHDYDIRTIYRNMWRDNYDNDKPKPIHKAFGDIEVDIMECRGTPDPRICPVDLVTIIDGKTKNVYTFCLTGVSYKPPKNECLTLEEAEEERKKKEMYEHRQQEQDYYRTHPEKLIEEAHKLFDENWEGFEYHPYFYTDERKMLVHLFQLIHKIKADFLLFWNIAFDIPFLIERMKVLGLRPEEIIPHPDFPNKKCYFKKDTLHFNIKNKTDFFHVSDYTVYIDQMVLYASIRKGGSELRNNRLTYIAKKEIEDEKLDYSDDATIRTLSYRNWLKYYLYNIKDVLLQYGIEEKTSDVDTLYVYSYENITQYENVFKQTVKLRNLQYRSWQEQGYVPGANVNAFMYDEEEEEEDDDLDDEELLEKKKKKDVNFEGALVGNPQLIRSFGAFLYGKRTNNIFLYSIDMDMSAFYPSTVGAMNIYPPCLIFKMILDASCYDVRGGNIPFNGITDVQMVKDNDNSFTGDVAKECMDNYITKNYISFAHKWLNFPSISDVYKTITRKKACI